MIASGLYIKIALGIIGTFVLVISILYLAKRKINETFSLAWGVVAVALIVASFAINPTQWASYVSLRGVILIFIILLVFIYAGFFVSIRISDLTRKNNELAIQVSLLNQENEIILNKLSKVIGDDFRLSGKENE